VKLPNALEEHCLDAVEHVTSASTGERDLRERR
jgi:hypothetical protein